MAERIGWEESLAALDCTEEQLAKVARGVAFGSALGLRCTGSSLYPECDWPPLQVLLYHARPICVTCAECTQINGAMIIGMGHGSFRQIGILEFQKDGTGENLKKISDMIHRSPVRELPRGQYWTEEKERAWRASLAEYANG